MYGLILAGGSGSRLWPLSRELYPKQLLDLQNTESLLQATFERLEKIIPASNIISMTGVKNVSNVKYQLSKLHDNPIVLSEPTSKNTAPAIIVGTEFIMQKTDSDPIILVVPSDHLIRDNQAFLRTVEKGKIILESNL